MKDKISFIGVGNMAGAMLGGVLGAGSFSEEKICLFDRFSAQYEAYAEHPFRIASSAADAAAFADFIVLSVKPQNYREILAEIREAGVVLHDKVFISLGAGISTEAVCACLGARAAVVRTMPSTLMLIGRGVTALCPNADVSDQDFLSVEALFAARSMTVRLPEDQMNAIIAVTSSSPAYLYLFIAAMLEGARAEGIDHPAALDMICETVAGSAEMIRRSDKTPEELIRMVQSPKGTTEQALLALKEHGVPAALTDAMHRCTLRAAEMSDDFTNSIGK